VSRRLGWILLLVGVAVIAACGGPPGLAQLKELPEASLWVPGSVDLHHAESEAIGSIEGPSPPFVTDVVGVNVDPAEVLRFYGDELPKASWTPDDRDPALIRTAFETDVAVWLKGDVIVRVSILRKDPWVPDSERAAEFQTFYQVTLLPASPRGASPSRASGRGQELADL
jgi:hypothetical protein